MKIAKQLPQFEGRRALLMVIGSQEIALYLATAGEIKLLESLRIEKPKFSDREGFFQKRSKGTGTTAPDEHLKEQMRQTLLRELRVKLKTMALQKPTVAYLFAPAHLAKIVQGALPAALRNLLNRTIRGDFFEAHPFELLEKLRPPSS